MNPLITAANALDDARRWRAALTREFQLSQVRSYLIACSEHVAAQEVNAISKLPRRAQRRALHLLAIRFRNAYDQG